MPGAHIVQDRDFLAVAASDPQTVSRTAKLLNARWKLTEQQPGNAELFDYFRKTAGESRGRPVGSIADGLAAADQKLEQTYTVAYIAHAPLEPRAAIAEWVDNKLTVWTGTQRPFGVRGELAEALHIPVGQIRVIVPDTGSGYGGKHSGECAIEAARLAMINEEAGESCLVSRGRVHVGLLSTSRCHRREERCEERRHDHSLGVP